MEDICWESPKDLTIDKDMFEYFQFVYEQQHGSHLGDLISWNHETSRLRIENVHETTTIERTNNILTKLKKDFYKNVDLIITSNDREKAERGIQNYRDQSTSIYPIRVVFRKIQEDSSQLRVVIMACSNESVMKCKHMIEFAIKRISAIDRKTRTFENVTPVSLPMEPEEKNKEGFLTYECMNVYISECNIEKWSSGEDVCIVNPTNDRYVPTGRVSQALINSGGQNLKEALQTLTSKSSKSVCECAVTSAGDLNVDKVIHLVCPSNSLSPNVTFDKKCKRNIFNSVVNCMKRADKAKMKTIVFPFIYTGKLRRSVKMCCLWYAYAVLEYSRTEKVENVGLNNVHFVSNNSKDVKDAKCVFKKTLPQHFGQLFRVIEETNLYSKVPNENNSHQEAPPYSRILVEKGNLKQDVLDDKVTMNQIGVDALSIRTSNTVHYVNIQSDVIESTYGSVSNYEVVEVPSQCDDKPPQNTDNLSLHSDRAEDADNKGYASINYGGEVPGKFEDKRQHITDRSDTEHDADKERYASIGDVGQEPGQFEDNTTQKGGSMVFESDTVDDDKREQPIGNLKRVNPDECHADIDNYDSIDIESSVNVHDKSVDTGECHQADEHHTYESIEASIRRQKPIQPLSRKCADSTFLQMVIHDFGGKITVSFENTDIRKSRCLGIVCPMGNKESTEASNGNDRIAASIKAAYHQTFSEQNKEDKSKKLFLQFKKEGKYATFIKCADDEEKKAKYIFQIKVPTLTDVEEVKSFADGVDRAFDGLMKKISKVNKKDDAVREVAIPLFGLNDTMEACLIETVCETIAGCLYRCVLHQDDDFKISKVCFFNRCAKIISYFEDAFKKVNQQKKV